MVDTPRDPPGLNEQWSDEISALLSQWGEVSLCYSWLHNYSQRKYKRKYHHMSIPIIVLSTLTGTANFADSYVPDGLRMVAVLDTRHKALCLVSWERHTPKWVLK